MLVVSDQQIKKGIADIQNNGCKIATIYSDDNVPIAVDLYTLESLDRGAVLSISSEGSSVYVIKA